MNYESIYIKNACISNNSIKHNMYTFQNAFNFPLNDPNRTLRSTLRIDNDL